MISLFLIKVSSETSEFSFFLLDDLYSTFAGTCVIFLDSVRKRHSSIVSWCWHALGHMAVSACVH